MNDLMNELINCRMIRLMKGRTNEWMSTLVFRPQTPARLHKLLQPVRKDITLCASCQNREIIKLLNLAVKISKTFLFYPDAKFLGYNNPHAINSFTYDFIP
jgi:hypothetical protein